MIECKFKNKWTLYDGYQGINTSWYSKNGSMFELQFHTEESITLKSNVAVHHDYEYWSSTNCKQYRQCIENSVDYCQKNSSMTVSGCADYLKTSCNIDVNDVHNIHTQCYNSYINLITEEAKIPIPGSLDNTSGNLLSKILEIKYSCKKAYIQPSPPNINVKDNAKIEFNFRGSGTTSQLHFIL